MIILIAESKTMSEVENSISPEELRDHTPQGEERASEIMKNLSDMSVEEVSQLIKVSDKMAIRILKQAYEFPNKGAGRKAIDSYTGVVFKAFDYDSLGMDQRNLTNRNLRIISSLYGLLKPEDIIKPYRVDYNTKLGPNHVSLAEYQKRYVTISLVKELQERGIHHILDLMPGEALKCIDKKLIKRFAGIWKVEFKELKDGGGFVTPNAGKLKKLRGELLREIVNKNITGPNELKNLSTDTFLPLEDGEYPDRIYFCV